MFRRWLAVVVVLAIPCGAAQAESWDDDDDEWGDTIVVVPGYWEAYAVEQPVAVPARPTGSEFEDQDGRTCREYRTTATIEGKIQRLFGSACRQADGSWQFQK